jgi:hypothetical protein
MSCQSSLGVRCANVDVDTWGSPVSKGLHEGVIYRPIILTVPAMCRVTFYQHAAVVLSAFRRCGVQGLDEVYSAVRGKPLRGDSIVVLHTHGRHGPYHPHLPVSATSGGYEGPGARWEHLTSLPYELLRRQGQWPLLTMLRQTLKTAMLNAWVDACCRQDRTGLVPHGQKGQVPSQYQSLARYVAKDVVSPPSAVRRIDRSDGERGTYHDRSHRTERVEHDTVDVDTCLGRRLQPIVPQGCKRMRYGRRAGHEDSGQGEGHDACGLGPSGGRRQRRGADHRSADLPAAVCAEPRARPFHGSALAA